MIPKRVSLENFLSFGEPAVEIVFGDDEPLWVVGGPNGVGKSAVFDAITYALFGYHRGGKQEAEELIRHQTNGFRLVFEFECGGVNYRITRTRSKGTTQKVQRCNDGHWEAVPNVNSARDVNEWSERTLGLGFEAFKASVLLRQGEADAIITGRGSERLSLLKKIIDAERFEKLSNRVHEQTKRRKNRLEDLRIRRDGLTPVTAEELTAAGNQVAETEAARILARDETGRETERLAFAKQWAVLEPKRGSLTRQIAEAQERAAEADRIRADKTCLDALTVLVPLLSSLLGVRARIATTQRALGEQQTEAERLAASHAEQLAAAAQEKQKVAAQGLAVEGHQREAQRLREAAERDKTFLTLADGVARLRTDLTTFPADLAAHLAAAQSRLSTVTPAAVAAAAAKSEVAALLRQAKDQQKKFSVVGGATCSQCGQIVSAQHAEDERARLASAVAALEEKKQRTEQSDRDAAAAKTQAESEAAALEVQARKRDDTANRLAEQEMLLLGLGVSTSAEELRRHLAEKLVEAERQAKEATIAVAARNAALIESARLETAAGKHEPKVAAAQRQLKATELTATAAAAEEGVLRRQLPEDWRLRAAAIDAQEVDALTTEERRLAASGVADRFRQLEQDAARREEWVNQLAELEAQATSIPPTARVPTVEVQAALDNARRTADMAETAWETARQAATQLTARDAAFRESVAQVAAAETEHRVHHKLDELLGKNGLQRELVRQAEREIVRLANDTANKLSDGDLSIELDDRPDEGDEAFALRIRRAADPTPIGVNYLSGSQKFRVAISVALAIGRFASVQARPLESVIIDEGFGSLDKDGLRAAADELNRLRGHLRRIVLVSHQEEFADRFPVVIQLSRGENGTIAEAVRR